MPAVCCMYASQQLVSKKSMCIVVPEFEVLSRTPCARALHGPSSLSIMETIDANVSMPMSTASSSDPDWAHLNDLPRPFDVICEDLASLGALSLQDFLSDATSTTVDFDVSFHLQSIASGLPEKGASSTIEAAAESQGAADAAPAKHYRLAVSLLNQTSQRIFGSTEPIKFEFLEEDPKSMFNLFLRDITP